jgi:hypothetical protein
MKKNKKEREIKMMERETLPMANSCGENCACGIKGEKHQWTEGWNLLSNKEFVNKYAQGLLEYLNRTIGERDNHVVDLMAHASTYAEANYSAFSEFF